MIGHFWNDTQLNFIIELVAACAVLTRPLKKREHFPVRLGLTMLGSILFWGGMILLSPLGAWIDPGSRQLVFQSLGYIVCFLGVSLPIFLICCRTDLINTISYAACAYAMQHISYVAAVTLYALTGRRLSMIMDILTTILVYGLLHLLILRSMPRHDRLERGQGISLISSVLIVFAVVVLSLATNQLFRQAEMFVIGQAYSFICCIFFLWMQVSFRQSMASQHESDVISVRTELSRRQQKNETAAYRNLLSMSREVREMLSESADSSRDRILERFDRISERYTGEISPHSEILNIILQEKKLRTAGRVEWTCACDPKNLSFMDVSDVYTILGNALDNAIECVLEYDAPEKRMIDVQVFSRKGLLNIRVDNYCDRLPEFDGELPVTTKDSLFGGYGLELVRETIARYSGEMRAVCENNVFSLRIVIPIPQE